MAAFSTFLRNSPRHLLQRVFAQVDATHAADLDWSAPRAAFVRMAVEKTGAWEADLRARIYRMADRISEMTDEVGQTALRNVAADKSTFDQFPSGYERTISMFLDDTERFRRAEEVRFTDLHRIPRVWTAFAGEAGKDVLSDEATINTFKNDIRIAMDSQQVHIDIFSRTRQILDAEPDNLVQLSIYREGIPDEVDVFINGELSRRPHRPVIEAAITYDKQTGVTELVGPDLKKRVQLAKIFTERLLNSEFTDKRRPSRVYDLEPLRVCPNFAHDTIDGIESVWVAMLQLSPRSGRAQRLTIEVPPPPSADVWTIMAGHFGGFNPLLQHWVIEQARLVIRFLPRSGQQKGRVLPVTIRGTDRCDLKGRNHDEQLISQKYLRRWKLLTDDRVK